MATLSTATSNFSSTVTALVLKRLEENRRAKLPFLTPESYIPAIHVKGTNGVMRFVAYLDLAATTTSLTEGSPPTAQTLEIATDEFTAAQKGGTIELTDLAQMQSPHDLITVAADRAAWQAALTMNTLAKDAIYGGVAVIKWSNGSARSTVSATITGALVKRMVSYLSSVNVARFADGYYRAIISPQQAYDLQTDTANGGWMDIYKAVDNAPLVQGELGYELGQYGGVRFLVSSIAQVYATAGASGVDVHSALLFGPGYFAWGDPESIEARFVPPGGDHSDPLGQKAIIGWKAYVGGVIADAGGAKYVSLETAATTL